MQTVTFHAFIQSSQAKRWLDIHDGVRGRELTWIWSWAISAWLAAMLSNRSCSYALTMLRSRLEADCTCENGWAGGVRSWWSEAVSKAAHVELTIGRRVPTSDDVYRQLSIDARSKVGKLRR